MKNLLYIMAHTLLFITTAKAQFFYDEKTDEEYKITSQTNKRIINAFLKEKKATAIEFNPNVNMRFPFRLKNKKGNWMLFDKDQDAVFMEKESKKYSFQFPTTVMKRSDFTLATHKGKTYLVNLYGSKKVETKMGFDEVAVLTKQDTLYRYDHNYDEKGNLIYNEKERIAEVIDKIAVKKANKWGLIELADGDIFLSHNFLYDSPKEVPRATGFQSYQLQMKENIRQNHNIDLLVALDENGYYFKGRNKNTKLFGLFVGEGEVFESIPSKYSNIIRHRSPEIFEVWKDGKVGYYNGNYKLVFKPKFDDFKYIHLDRLYKRLCVKTQWQMGTVRCISTRKTN